MRRSLRVLIAMCVALVGLGSAYANVSPTASPAVSPTMTGSVPRAHCGQGDRPETGIQGRVSLADRESGRSRLGYSCNLRLVGRYQGEGSSWVSQSYRHCAYTSTHSPSAAVHPGVQVIDVRDPQHPRRVGSLTSPAMLGTWESLKVNPARGLLAAVSAPSPAGNGVGYFSVYDIRTDCLHPRLLNSFASSDLTLPANGVGHEGNWSPDGRTYWSASLSLGMVTAIDVADPRQPRILFEGQTSAINHGLSVSRDGRRLYIAKIGMGSGSALDANGLDIYDVSQVQDRKPAPRIRLVGQVTWTDGTIGQHAINVTWLGRPYVIFVDESGAGAARIIDISNESRPVVVSRLKLAIHLPKYADVRSSDTRGTGFFGYEGHYCDVDRLRDPTALACGYFQSGVRVFDVRRPRYPREIAYFNPPAQVGKALALPSSEHAASGLGGALTTDWCSSPPRFVGRQLWVTCQDNGFMVLRFTHGSYPLVG